MNKGLWGNLRVIGSIGIVGQMGSSRRHPGGGFVEEGALQEVDTIRLDDAWGF